MAVKKIIQNAFEQIREVGKDMAKSSAKQVVETLSPWDMIRNSFTNQEIQSSNPDSHEKKNDKGNSTSLDLKKLQKEYANQDEQKIKQMSERLFRMVNKDSEQVARQKDNTQLTKQREETHTTSEKQRAEQDKQMRIARSGIPKGKEKGSIMGKKKRSGSAPEPLEFKPASSKQ